LPRRATATPFALRDPYGAPVASGMYNGEPIVVAAPAEFQVFVVRVATARVQRRLTTPARAQPNIAVISPSRLSVECARLVPLASVMLSAETSPTPAIQAT
jgi:hypothetical protein